MNHQNQIVIKHNDYTLEIANDGLSGVTLRADGTYGVFVRGIPCEFTVDKATWDLAQDILRERCGL